MHRDRPPDTQEPLPPSISLDSRFPQHVHEWLTAAIQDRHLQVVDLHKRIVDPHAVEHAEQMLRGRDQYALAHQTGGIADARHVTPTRGHREIVEIGTKENDAGARRGRNNSDIYTNAAMKSHTTGFDGALHSGFKLHTWN